MRQPTARRTVPPEVSRAEICAPLCILISDSWPVRRRSVSRGLSIERGHGNVAGAKRMERRNVNTADLQAWVGKIESRTDQITSTPMAALSATLDIDAPPPRAAIRCRRCGIGCGSCQFTRNPNSVPMDMQRRANSCRLCRYPCACGQVGVFEFRHPLRGANILRAPSRILDVRQKEGRTGPLIFVIVRHEIGDADGIALSEEQDIVCIAITLDRPRESQQRRQHP